ncbi:uncharacterized protein [Drosophila virilis]|nr:uncharacterized protein LOC116650986 isoform X2 [Drosophila virilis]
MEDNSTISIEGATNDNEVVNMVGIAELQILGGKKRMRIPGIRLEFCKLLGASSRRSLLSFFNKGIQQADSNFPKKCPFKRNTTYSMRHMKFDANYLPYYLAEYNFSFIGKFMENAAMLFEVRAKGSFCYINNDCTGAGANSSAT